MMLELVRAIKVPAAVAGLIIMLKDLEQYIRTSRMSVAKFYMSPSYLHAFLLPLNCY